MLRPFLLLLLIFVLASAFAQQTVVDLGRVRSVVTQWSEAHNAKDFSAFRSLYADTVLYYTDQLTGEACVAQKTKLLSDRPRYRQRILTDLVVTVHIDGIIYCRFTKEVDEPSGPQKYPSYLLLKLAPDHYLIVGEGDKVTDREQKFYLTLDELVPSRELKIIQAEGKTNEPTIEMASDTSNRSWIFFTAAIVSFLLLAGLVWVRREKIFAWIKQTPVEKEPLLPAVQPAFHFERHIVQRFDLQPEQFTLKDWRTEKSPENNYPDLQYDFHQHNRSARFSIVCRYWSEPAEKITVMSQEQLDRYHRFQFESGQDIYLVMGFGGRPDQPQALYVLHFNELPGPQLSYDQLQAYRKHTQPFTFDPINNKLS